MNVSSSTGAGTNISAVVFQADRFEIHTATGGNKRLFSATSTDVLLGDVLTVDLPNAKVYIGVGAYGNANTPFFVDDNGRFSLKDKLTWDGSTLAISGAVNSSSGTIGGFNIASTVLQNSNIVLDSSGLVLVGPIGGDHTVMHDNRFEFLSGAGFQGHLKYNAGATPQTMQLYGNEGVTIASYNGSGGVQIDLKNTEIRLSGGATSVDALLLASSAGAAGIIENWGAVYIATDHVHPFRMNSASLLMFPGTSGADYGEGRLYFSESMYWAYDSGRMSLFGGDLKVYDDFICVGLGSFAGDIVVSGYGIGDFVSYSSQTIKDNIRPLEYTLANLLEVEGRRFEYNALAGPNKVGVTDIGVIAEQVELIFPEIVVRNQAGLAAVNYPKFIPIIIEGMREQQQQIAAQNVVIANLTARLDALEQAA